MNHFSEIYEVYYGADFLGGFARCALWAGGLRRGRAPSRGEGGGGPAMAMAAAGWAAEATATGSEAAEASSALDGEIAWAGGGSNAAARACDNRA